MTTQSFTAQPSPLSHSCPFVSCLFINVYWCSMIWSSQIFWSLPRLLEILIGLGFSFNSLVFQFQSRTYWFHVQDFVMYIYICIYYVFTQNSELTIKWMMFRSVRTLQLKLIIPALKLKEHALAKRQEKQPQINGYWRGRRGGAAMSTITAQLLFTARRFRVQTQLTTLNCP